MGCMKVVLGFLDVQWYLWWTSLHWNSNMTPQAVAATWRPNRHQTIGCSSTVETPKIMGLEFSPHLGLYHNFSGWLQYHDTMLIAISSAKKAPPSGIPSPSRNWMRTVVRAIEGWKPTHLGFCSRQRAEFWRLMHGINIYIYPLVI